MGKKYIKPEMKVYEFDSRPMISADTLVGKNLAQSK